MGLFCIIYRRNVNRGLIKGICKGNIYMTQSTSKDYIRLRPKVYGSILGSLYSKTRDPNSNFNSILSANRQINKEIKLDVRTVLIILH